MEAFRIKVGTWFNLPKLERNDFMELMRSGIYYKSGSGFMVREVADMAGAKRVLEKVLTKPVYVGFNCAICNRETDCSACEYKYYCPVETTGGACICNDCMQKKSLADYLASVKLMMQNLK
ncbi:MAG: hypothetical protein JRN26_02815 [Nitrososphaerota archaeon]|jgi:hypothetical protein|nr:hypothetical protein [Nitrososphaerota archaeon]MDG6931548.1 hypothetical protein [Nitrososphaerota archaeon]MDG6935807.1 hypothetical protein [Nitrososphaerota archaeon]MDG6943466.1 hypothetical protein [Nitrososphaerota archaeon]